MMICKVAVTFVLCALLSDAVPSVARPAEVPESSWEQVPGGVAIALTFDNDGYVTVHLKNSSKSDLEIREPWSDSIQLFYVNENGKQVLLRRHRKGELVDSDEIQYNIDMSTGPLPLPAVTGLWYSGAELNLIETRPILCRISAYDPAAKQTLKVESSPKLLYPLVPGTLAFRTNGYSTAGTFTLTDGNRVDVSCISPDPVMVRSRHFHIFLYCPGDDKFLGVRHVEVRGDSFSKTFGGALEHASEKGWMGLYVEGPVPREQFRQMVSGHELVFAIENFKTLTLNENQLAQIRALLAYTDKLPEPKLNPYPPGVPDNGPY